MSSSEAGDRDRDASRLEARLLAFCGRRENGETLSAEEFAAESPDAGPELLAACKRLEATEALFPTGALDRPATVGPYRVLGDVGSGGMGRILRVEHRERPGVSYALKLLHVELEVHERSLERFRREARALAELDHPGLVRIVDSGTTGTRPYFVMELVDGVNLGDRLRALAAGGASDDGEGWLTGDGPPAERAARIVARVARALATAHAVGVLHRDLNPHNVVLRPNGEPVVIDFGLARSEASATLTASGDMLGTPQYMAPEQARGERVDERADVFGLGALLFALTTRSAPRRESDTIGLLRSAGARPVRGPRDVDPSVPRPLDTIARRALSFRREWRYRSAGALADDLERWLAGEPIHATRAGLGERGHDLWLRHKVALIVATIALLAGLAAFALGRESDEERARRFEAALHGGIVAWLDDDRDALARHAGDLADVAPDEPHVELFRALAGGRLPDLPGDPAIAAFVEGERLRRAGRPDAALLQFEVAHNLRPAAPSLLIACGLAHLAVGNLEPARKALEEVAWPLGASKRLHRTLCEVYADLELWDDARKAGATAIRAAPRDARAWAACARAHWGAGDPASATDALRTARSLAQGDATLLALVERLASVGQMDAARAVRAVLAE